MGFWACGSGGGSSRARYYLQVRRTKRGRHIIPPPIFGVVAGTSLKCGTSLCVCMRVGFCMCVSVRCHTYGHTKRPRSAVDNTQPLSFAAKKSVYSSTAGVQQQRYNGSRAPSSRLCASSHGACACGWRTAAGDRATTLHD